MRVIRVAAVCTWLVLTVVSLVPGQDRPHTGAPGNVEHALAYFGSALLTRFGSGRVRSRWQVLGFSCAAAGFEVAQIWIPGRHSGVDNWAASSLGALLGTVVARIAAHSLRRRSRGAGPGRTAPPTSKHAQVTDRNLGPPESVLRP